MKRQLEFHPEVTNDIKGSYLWYEDKLQGLGNRFLNELEDGYTSIQNFPDTWANFQDVFEGLLIGKLDNSKINAIKNDMYDFYNQNNLKINLKCLIEQKKLINTLR